MHETSRPARRNMFRQPFDQALHGVDLFGFRGAILLRPALDLARDVILAAAEIGEADLRRIERMQARDGVVHGVVDRGALGRVGARHLRLPEHAAVDEAHHIKRRAGNALVRAIGQRLCHRKFLRMQRTDHAVFAVDRVRRRQQLARRLAAQDVTPRRRLQQISRVRLPALELLDDQRAGEIFHVCRQIVLKACTIEPQRGRRLLGAGKSLLAVEGHYRSALICARRRTKSARRRRSCNFASSASPCPLR